MSEPPKLTKEQIEAQVKGLEAKYAALETMRIRESQFKGYTTCGEPKYGNTLDGFTGPALAQLEVAIKQNSGKNLENNLMSIEGPNPLIEGQVHTPQIILPNTMVKRSKIDIDDIFGIK